MLTLKEMIGHHFFLLFSSVSGQKVMKVFSPLTAIIYGYKTEAKLM